LHKLPSEIDKLPPDEFAFVIAAINVYLEDKKKEEKKPKKPGRRKR
jgi:hypothetical protein